MAGKSTFKKALRRGYEGKKDIKRKYRHTRKPQEYHLESLYPTYTALENANSCNTA